jgi:hypothetical protein
MNRNIEEYGNRLQIVGFLLGNGEETDMIMLPEADVAKTEVNMLQPTTDQLHKIFFQLDTLQITNDQKVVLRKSQRQIDQNVAWSVFRRDNYTCAYCGNDHVPLTVDHLVTWEEDGDTVEGNLLSACRKCNKTRDNQTVPEFLESAYYKGLDKSPYSGHMRPEYILEMYEKALLLPKRKPRKR